jgi:hypothetical protein
MSDDECDGFCQTATAIYAGVFVSDGAFAEARLTSTIGPATIGNPSGGYPDGSVLIPAGIQTLPVL